MKAVMISLFVVSTVLSSAALAGEGTPLPGDYNAHQWKLVWSDDFNGSGQPDPTKWTVEVDGSGGGNHEAQYYTDRLDNAFVKDGHLVIEAKKEDYQNKSYTSAILDSKQSWTYGRFEIRAKLPTGRGTWPAAWLLADKQVYGSQFWPDNGEVDMLEAVGYDQNVIHFTLHDKFFNYMHNNNPMTWMRVADADQQFHTYTFDWYPDHMDFWLDHVKYMTFEKQGDWQKWPFDQNMHLILNLAVGGDWGGLKGIDDSIFPARFEFDSVKVYQQVDP
jgi:licheninase